MMAASYAFIHVYQSAHLPVEADSAVDGPCRAQGFAEIAIHEAEIPAQVLQSGV